MRVSLVLISFTILFHSASASAQLRPMGSGSSSSNRLELTPFAGYQFGGSLSVIEGDLNLKDNLNYGLALDIWIPAGMQVELLYNRQDTQLEVKERISGQKSNLFDMSVNYFQIGVLRGVEQGNTMPFGFASLGATLFDPQGSGTGSEWLFSATLGLGVKIYASENIGLRFQANLLLPFQWSGGALWCGTGGCSVGVSSGSSIVQGNVLGGLIFMF